MTLVAAGLVGAAAVTYLISGGGEGGDPCQDASSECESDGINVE
jgi:hypothetical protein